MPVNATFGVLSMPVFTGKYRWQIPPVNATGQPLLLAILQFSSIIVILYSGYHKLCVLCHPITDHCLYTPRLVPTWQNFGTITCDGLHGIMKLYIDKP